MAVIINQDGTKGVHIRILEDNEKLEVNEQTAERVFQVGPKEIVEPGWKTDLAHLRMHLEKK